MTPDAGPVDRRAALHPTNAQGSLDPGGSFRSPPGGLVLTNLIVALGRPGVPSGLKQIDPDACWVGEHRTLLLRGIVKRAVLQCRCYTRPPWTVEDVSRFWIRSSITWTSTRPVRLVS